MVYIFTFIWRYRFVLLCFAIFVMILIQQLFPSLKLITISCELRYDCAYLYKSQIIMLHVLCYCQFTKTLSCKRISITQSDVANVQHKQFKNVKADHRTYFFFPEYMYSNIFLQSSKTKIHACSALNIRQLLCINHVHFSIAIRFHIYFFFTQFHSYNLLLFEFKRNVRTLCEIFKTKDVCQVLIPKMLLNRKLALANLENFHLQESIVVNILHSYSMNQTLF